MGCPATHKRGDKSIMNQIYDNNNNCFTCDQYVYDQHKKSCPNYVKETLSQFYERIQTEKIEVKA